MDATGPDIHAEAVLIVEPVVPVHREGLVVGPPAGTGRSRGRGTESPAGTDVRPRVGIDSRGETLGLGIGNALVDENAVIDIAGNRTGHRLDSRLLGRSLQAANALHDPPGRLSAGDGERHGEQKDEVGFQCHNKRFSSDAKFINNLHNLFFCLSIVFVSVLRTCAFVQTSFYLFKNHYLYKN